MERVEQARRHAADADDHVRRQHRIVAWLDARGLDASIARDLLATYERILVMHTADRDRLIKKLAENPRQT